MSAASSASRTSGVPSSPGPSSKVKTAPCSTRSSPGSSVQSWSIARCSWNEGIRSSCPDLAGAQQALAQLALLLGGWVERRRVGQRVHRRETEQALEERGRAVEDRAELGAAAILDQATLLERGNG